MGDWLLVNYRGRYDVAFSSEGWIALRKNDDALNEAPDTVAGHSEIADNGDAEKENGKYRYGESKEAGENAKNKRNKKTAAKEDAVKEAAAFLAEVPVVSAKATEENTKNTSSGSRARGGRNDVIKIAKESGRLRRGGLRCVWLII